MVVYKRIKQQINSVIELFQSVHMVLYSGTDHQTVMKMTMMMMTMAIMTNTLKIELDGDILVVIIHSEFYKHQFITFLDTLIRDRSESDDKNENDNC